MLNEWMDEWCLIRADDDQVAHRYGTFHTNKSQSGTTLNFNELKIR